MGFLDEAKKKIGRLSEETVRVMDFEDDDKEKEKKSGLKLKDSIRVPSVGRRSRHSGRESEMYEDTVRNEPSVTDQSNDKEYGSVTSSNSAFTVDDDDNTEFFFRQQDRAHEEYMQGFGDIPVPSAHEGRIQDVLKLLDIPATFELDPIVFMPEDFDEIDFDIQVPQGYEIGQVNAFKDRSRKTVEILVNLLRLRNKHVAELATTIDRLQVDAENAKFDAQIANGISIAPTNDSIELENENAELRIINRRLEKEIEALRKGGTGGNSSREAELEQENNRLSDHLSVTSRENEDLRQQVYDLKNTLALLEEKGSALDETSAAVRSMSPDDEGFFVEDNISLGDIEESGDDDFDLSLGGDDISLDLDDEDTLHSQGDSANGGFTEISSSSVFNQDDDDLGTFLKENEQYYQGHDYSSEDDELERLMGLN